MAWWASADVTPGTKESPHMANNSSLSKRAALRQQQEMEERSYA